MADRMSVDFFSGWLRDQWHDDSEWREENPDKGESDYIEEHWTEVIDMLPEAAWEEVAKAMWHVYDPHHVMHDFHPIEEE